MFGGGGGDFNKRGIHVVHVLVHADCHRILSTFLQCRINQ